MHKEILSAAAIALTFLAFYRYLRGILRGAIRPHVFSWVIWGTTTFVVFLAQMQARGGVGAWAIGVSGVLTIIIAVLAWMRRSDVTITRADRIFFATALLSLPLWYLTSNPLWAVIVLTTVDLLGFGPTFRKAYELPHSESLTFYATFLVRNCLVLLALESYSAATVLFPAAVGVACALLMAMIVLRRRVIVRV